ncbi:MAG TPA: hypothetical protein VK533_02345 [Sphingomonas sp.]|nr:hypothetical protein [Sphingomonas sp.]
MPRWLWLALLAVALMSPAIFGPLRLNDSHWINYSWSEQFTAAIAHGDLWPRWLPQSHGGLGAPDFYFYGPVAFWLAAPFGLVGLAPWPALLGAATLGLWFSGLAMGRFLNGRTRHPALGAALYMALPYHLLDFGMRGALAEFVAYATLPLVALGIARRRIWLIAAGYALLILTHLPTALLASLFLIPVLALTEAWKDRPALLRIGAGLVLGLMLAAPYLLPAILLQRYVAIATMTAVPALQAARWTILSPDTHMRDGLFLVGLIAAALALPALALLRRDRWGWFVLAMLALGLGLIPALWAIPLLAAVQFPWRLFVLADFGVAWIVARASWPMQRLLLLVVPALALTSIILWLQTSNQSVQPVGRVLAHHPDVIEYLPAGVSEPYAAFSRRALDLAAHTPPTRSTNGWTTVRLHYFPIWQVRCANGLVPSGAEPGTGLLRYRGEGCAVERRRLPIENFGLALSLVAMALLAVGPAVAARRRRQALTAPATTTLH